MLGRLGVENWFKIGDRDLATNLMRTNLLTHGYRLSQVTEKIRNVLKVKARVLPMTDDRVRTVVETRQGVLRFQEYFVKHGHSVEIEKIRFEGLEKAQALPDALEAIRNSDIIAIAPSNPIVSIGPILGLKGFRDELRRCKGLKLAVSPIIGGRALKGPADVMLKKLGIEATAYGVYTLYRDIIDIMVIDIVDHEVAEKIGAEGKRCIALDTLMDSPQAARRLASQILESIM